MSLFYSNAFFSCVSVFGTEPDMIRDGSTIPIAKIFQDTIQKSVMMLPLGAVDDGEHSQNEKINRLVRPVGAHPSLHRPGSSLREPPHRLHTSDAISIITSSCLNCRLLTLCHLNGNNSVFLCLNCRLLTLCHLNGNNSVSLCFCC